MPAPSQRGRRFETFLKIPELAQGRRRPAPCRAAGQSHCLSKLGEGKSVRGQTVMQVPKAGPRFGQQRCAEHICGRGAEYADKRAQLSSVTIEGGLRRGRRGHTHKRREVR